jgi:hypothetical protein
MRSMQDVSWSLFALLVLTLSATAAEQPAQKPEKPSASIPGRACTLRPTPKRTSNLPVRCDPARSSVDVESSKDWVAVQHPFFGAVSLSGGKPPYNDVRDATEIVCTKNEAVKKQQAKQSDHPDSKPATSPQ